MGDLVGAGAGLDELAAGEEEIARLVASMTGTIEEQTERLEADGVFDRYRDLFLSYLALAEPPRSNLEALKRATFLAWYEVSEPAFCTGLGNLPGDARHRIIDLLEALVAELDGEIRWMLAWYYFLTDFAFPSLDSHPGIAALLRSGRPEEWRSEVATADRMSGRGLMGRYWRSIFESAG